MPTATRRVRILDRLEDYISPEPNTGCWLWTGSVSGYGYAMTVADNKTIYVHRRIYEKYVGPIPAGHQIDHICRVKCCVNPRHLRPLTPTENVKAAGGCFAAGKLQSAKTHCPAGHEYTPKNTYRLGRKRHCRACHAFREMNRRNRNVTDRD